MSVLSPSLFYIFSGLALICSLAMVTKRSPVSSAFSLVLVFAAVAGIFALMGAHFLAGLQILVSAGAVMVLFVFVIMLLGADIPTTDGGETSTGIKVLAAAAVLVAVLLMGAMFQSSVMPSAKGTWSLAAIDQAGGNTRVLARSLFTDYILHIQLVGVLLFAGIVAALGIAMRKKKAGKA